MGNRLTYVIFLFLSLAIALYATAEDRTVENAVRTSLETDPGEGFFNTGNGFFVAGGRFIVTAAHVVGGCRHFQYDLPGNQISQDAYLITWDGRRDLAILRPETPHFSGVNLVTSTPRGGVQTWSVHSMKMGLNAPKYPQEKKVSVQGKYLEFGPSKFHVIEEKLDIGSSGSPIIGSDGKAHGMVTARLQRNGEYISLGLPGYEIASFVTDVLQPARSLSSTQGDTSQRSSPLNNVVKIRCN